MNRIKLPEKKMSYLMTEQLKSFRTSLQFCGDDKKVILITSCLPSEGKSTTVTNIAKMISELGKSVLVIDSDMRKSVLASRFLVEGEVKGLSHFLTGQCSLSDAVCATNFPKLHFLLAGPVPPNPSELLSSGRFKAMIEAFRGMYDYILIDSAPIGLVTDGTIVAGHCDGAVLIVEKGRVKRTMAIVVKNKLAESGCPLLGAVLNKVDIQHHKGYYGKKYDYREYENHNEERNRWKDWKKTKK